VWHVQQLAKRATNEKTLLLLNLSDNVIQGSGCGTRILLCRCRDGPQHKFSIIGQQQEGEDLRDPGDRLEEPGDAGVKASRSSVIVRIVLRINVCIVGTIFDHLCFSSLYLGRRLVT